MGKHLIILAMVMIPASAVAGQYFEGAYGSRQCSGFSVSRSEHLRLERDYRNLTRQFNQRVRECNQDNQRLRQNYHQQLKQQSMLQSSLQDTSTRNAEALSAIAQDKELPADFFDRPSRQEYDDLQDRYHELIRKYRNMERDLRELQSENINQRGPDAASYIVDPSKQAQIDN